VRSIESSPGAAWTNSGKASVVMVLLVDDQLMVGEAIRRTLLSEPDIHFHYCANPANALAVAAQVAPTVILQDLVMPGIDGLTLVRQYRCSEATRDIPVVVLSTTEDPAVKSDAFAAGANDYLVKLPSAVELIARIRYHSKAYSGLLQRDEAFRALRRSQQQLIEANFELQRLTHVDGLTELSNRRYFDQQLEMEWKRGAREQTPLSVLMIDVDSFKRFNDTYGHPAGDEALKKVARAMQQSAARSTDVAARFGGEEFVLMLPATPLEGAKAVGEELRVRVQDLKIPQSASGVAECVTVSVGVASMVPNHEDSPLRLIEVADKALYKAKGAGRNRVVANE
jgi:two-component system chemotaxis family response regulator WspR